jgi:hypothetical protein
VDANATNVAMSVPIAVRAGQTEGRSRQAWAQLVPAGLGARIENLPGHVDQLELVFSVAVKVHE